MDATGCPGPAQAAPAGCAPSCAAATALLGIPGLVVTSVTVTEDGWTVADVVTDPAAEAARCCPKCGATATRVKERPRTAPRDVLIGDRQILLRWGKTRWYCSNPDCDQGTFTEALPAVPSRARLTARLRTRLGECIGDDLMSAVATARRYGVSDRTAARAFDAYASQQLAGLDDEQDLGEAAGSMSSAAAPPPTAPTRRPASPSRPAPNGSPTWSTSAPAAASAWPKDAPPPRRKTCWPATPGGCATWPWTCPRPTAPAPRPA